MMDSEKQPETDQRPTANQPKSRLAKIASAPGKAINDMATWSLVTDDSTSEGVTSLIGEAVSALAGGAGKVVGGVAHLAVDGASNAMHETGNLLSNSDGALNGVSDMAAGLLDNASDLGSEMLNGAGDLLGDLIEGVFD